MFCADENYIKFTCVLIYSIVLNSNEKHNFVFHILSDTLSDETKDKIKLFAKELNLDIKIYEISDLDFQAAEAKLRNSLLTYFRFKIPSILDTNIDKCLYLDTDMLCLCDINELFNLNLNEQLAAVSRDIFPKDKKILYKNTNTPPPSNIFNLSKALELHKELYFNAGLLLINLKKFRENEIEQKCFYILNNYTNYYVDQDILNSLLQKECLYIDFAYNAMIATYKEHFKPKFFKDEKQDCDLYTSKDEYKKAMKNPKIIHYTSYKPWLKQKKFNFYYTISKFLPFLRLHKGINANYKIAKSHKLWWNIALKTPVFKDELKKMFYKK